MKQKIHYLFMLLLLLVTGVGGVKAQATYKLEKVTKVEAGGLYVFEQSGHVMDNSISSNALQTTTTYKAAGLSGAESYVWTLESATGGFYMKNVSLSNYPFLNNAKDKTNLSFGSKSSIWSFSLQSDETFLINNPGNSNRLLAYPDEKTYTYKAYAASNASTSPHAIVVYKLVEETGDEPVVVAAPTFSPEAGEVSQGTEVTISTATEGATIYYTIDGSTPTENSTKGSSVVINEPTTLKAIAIKDGMTNSAVATAEYVIKADYVTLPFNWEGGASATLAALDGVTLFGLGSDYADNNAPYLVKFDGTGDYIQVKTDGQPGIVSIDVKMIGGNNTSKISVQGSADGETFTDVEELNISGAQNSTHELSTTNSFAVTDRYVRLYFTKGSNVGVGPISIEKPSIDPVISANNLEIGYDVENGAIDYEIINPVDGGVVSASTDSDWLTFASNGTTFTSTTNEAFSARTASVTLTYTYGNNKTVTKEITITQAGNPNVPGTASNPFTVTQANEFISSLDNNVNSEEVYVKGVISGIKSIDVSKYERAQYYISDDGTSTEQLLVYNGYYINGAKFTANDQIQVGDNVVVYGSLVNYNGTYEVAQNNKLISLDRPVKPEAGLEYKTTEVTATRGVAFTTPELTNPNNVDVTYSSSNEAVATVNAEGAVTLLKAGETTITASFAGDANYKAGSASYTLTVTVQSHKATFFVNGQQQGEPIDIAEDDPITFPVVEEQEINGKKFVGWTTAAIDGTTNDKPKVLVTSATMGESDITYYAVYAKVIGEGSSTTIEVTNEAIKNYASGHNSYSNGYDLEGWTGRYAINNNSGTYSLQLGYNAESSKSAHNSHLTTPNCEPTITSITINTQNNTASGRTFYLCNATDLGCATSEDAIYGQGSITAQNGSVTIPVTGNANQVHIYPNGTAYIASISLTYGTPASYSDYCTTVVAPVKPAKPIVFHDGGKYEGTLTVAMAGEGTIKYTLNDNGETKDYTAPFTISETTTIKAWTEQDGAKSDEVEKTFTIVEKAKGAVVEDGYYTIKTKEGKYVNVAGRKTVTLASDAKSAGTVIRVSADANGVKVLRSQGVDVPGYAKKAMNYVPEIVQLAVDKLHAEGSGAILGEHGLDAIMEEFNKSFDYNLYLEKSGDAYRIYGRTPSMKPVVDFYAKNKANVDAKLPQLEAFINSAIDKVLDKTGGRGASILVDFKLHDVWQNMGGTLTEPVDEASTLKFYEEVLSSETNVWNFAYQTAMIYWGNLKNHPRFPEIKDKLGDYSKYIDKVENIRPNFKYYIVPSGSGVDFISQGNEAIINNNASAAWTMQECKEFQVELPTEKNVTVYPTSGGTQTTYDKEYYTTLYTDFAYTLPKGVKAYKVTAIDEKTGVAKREEITGTIPAQTPVLLVGESNTATLTLSTEAGTAITGNLLVGPDALINEYQIQTPQVVSLFEFAKEILGESAYETYVKKYEHLMLKNAGTVNNKYFFGLTEDDLGDVTNLRILGMGYENELGFHDIWEKIDANKAFILTNDYDPVKLFLVGDVNRDGAVSIADVTALVNIILGKAKYPEDNDKYDFEAANVNGDENITIADVTALVNIILGK